MTDPRVLAWHAGKALQGWSAYCRQRGAEMPPELDALAETLLLWVTTDLGGSPLEVLAGMTDGRSMEPLLMDTEDAAAVMAVSPSTVKRLVRSGDLTSVKVGRRTLFRRDDLEQFTAQLHDSDGTRPPAGPSETSPGATQPPPRGTTQTEVSR